ncbi:hypothetical protein [Paractinoplanes maris]|uniref:hypothetical protein n=1 Tax=Paractinoplanes maris TaxID=1734446 RepID=UPI00201FB5A8|nr:hypothetical protein [Actinoplanes maris]
MTTAVTYGLVLLFALAWVAAWPALGQLDNELEEAPVSLRSRIRAYLGTDTLPRMEQAMATWTTVLNGLVEQTTAASAAQATSFTNLQNAITRQTTAIGDLQSQLETAVANGDSVPEGMQAKVVEISQALDDMKKAADTADNGFEPVEETPAEEPVEVPGGDTSPVDQPVEPGTDVPPAEETTEQGNTARRR